MLRLQSIHCYGGFFIAQTTPSHHKRTALESIWNCTETTSSKGSRCCSFHPLLSAVTPARTNYTKEGKRTRVWFKQTKHRRWENTLRCDMKPEHKLIPTRTHTQASKFTSDYDPDWHDQTEEQFKSLGKQIYRCWEEVILVFCKKNKMWRHVLSKLPTH